MERDSSVRVMPNQDQPGNDRISQLRSTPSRGPVPDDADGSIKSRKRLLDRMERISEVLFGLIMVLSFTCLFSVADAGHSEVRKMLIGALGLNLAWGIIDAVFYLMGRLSEHGHNILALRAVRRAADRAVEGHQQRALRKVPGGIDEPRDLPPDSTRWGVVVGDPWDRANLLEIHVV